MYNRHGHHLLPMPGAHTATAFPLLYVKQQEGCYIILVYEISLIIESLFLYHNANGRRSPRKEALADVSPYRRQEPGR